MENRNATLFITGKGGSGKSYLGLRLARDVDPGFNADNLSNRIAFDPDSFLKIIDSNLPAGSAIIYDDCAASLGARDWQSFVNKSIGRVMMTYRNKNLCSIFTLQRASEVDLQVRSRSDFVIWCDGVNRKYNYNVCRIYENIFYPGGRILPSFMLDSKGRKIKLWYIKKVDDGALIQKYESLVNPWKAGLPGRFLKEKKERESAKECKVITFPNRRCLDCGNEWFSQAKSKFVVCSLCKRGHTIAIGENV